MFNYIKNHLLEEIILFHILYTTLRYYSTWRWSI